MASIHTFTIGGYNPAYDAKQLAEFSVVGGKNFMPTVQGYKSEFGSSILTDRLLSHDLLIGAQPFSIGESVLLLANNYGIMFYDPDSESWVYQVKSETMLDSKYPWSMAYVGGDYFFCRQGFGLARYRPTDNSWIMVTEDVPNNPVSITSSGGRLIVLGDSTYAWSAIGDGANLKTSLDTGAGFQALSLAGGGKPLAVKEYTLGFIVYTTSGIVRAEGISGINPFYHRVLTASDYSPVAPRAITEIGNGTHVFLTKTGLYATSGDYPESFEPSFSKWLTGTLLRYLLNSRYDLPVSLTYSTTNKWLILSYAEYSIVPSPYSLAFVYDFELGRWGRFDQPHYFVGVGYIPDGVSKGYRLLTAGYDYALRVFDKDYAISQPVDTTLRNNFPTPCPSPRAFKSTDSPDSLLTVFTACARIETYDFAALPSKLGYYQYESVSESPEPELVYPEAPIPSQGAIFVDMMGDYNLHVDMMADEPNESIDMMVGDLRNLGFTTTAVMGSQFIELGEKAQVQQLSRLDSKLEIGLYHIDEFDDINQSSIVTNFAEIHDEWVGEDTIIDMETVADITIDMEMVEDEVIDMGMGFVSKPQFRTTLISSSDGYGNRDLHRYEIEPVSIVGNRYNYNSYSTGLYHGFEVETKEVGDFYHLKQMQINIVQGGLIYDRT